MYCQMQDVAPSHVCCPRGRSLAVNSILVGDSRGNYVMSSIIHQFFIKDRLIIWQHGLSKCVKHLMRLASWCPVPEARHGSREPDRDRSGLCGGAALRVLCTEWAAVYLGLGGFVNPFTMF